MNTEKYNGWTNYETWKVSLELVDYESLVDMLEHCKPNHWDSFVDYVEVHIREIAQEGTQENSFGDGALSMFLDRVNWDEIAEHAQIAYAEAC